MRITDMNRKKLPQIQTETKTKTDKRIEIDKKKKERGAERTETKQ